MGNVQSKLPVDFNIFNIFKTYSFLTTNQPASVLVSVVILFRNFSIDRVSKVLNLKEIKVASIPILLRYHLVSKQRNLLEAEKSS